jgi:hypothetical protein
MRRVGSGPRAERPAMKRSGTRPGKKFMSSIVPQDSQRGDNFCRGIQ